MTLKTDTPLAKVSDDSREAGRTPIPRQVDKLRRELESLKVKKKSLEDQLRETVIWKRGNLARILSPGHSKSTAVAATNQLEADYHERRQPILRQVRAIEERIHAIKGRLSDKKKDTSSIVADREESKLKTLRSIETLLQRLVDKFDA